MPFTFSHPAIILALSKGKLRLSLTGLVMGSIVPDFEFFFRMRVTENIGHHLPGFFVFDMPLALLFCFLYHNTIRNVFIKNLPLWFQQRFSGFKTFNWNAHAKENKITIFISLVIGVASHLLWDAFTHYDGYFVEMLPVLSTSIHIYHWLVHIYSILQLVSSVWGLWVVYLFIKAMPIDKNVMIMHADYFNYWIILALISVNVLILRFVIWFEYKTLPDVLFACIGSVMYGWIVTSIFYKKKNPLRWQELKL